MLNMAFRAWGHKWLYDREELHRRLHEAGFTRVKDVEWGGSEEVELRNRETRRAKHRSNKCFDVSSAGQIYRNTNMSRINDENNWVETHNTRLRDQRKG
jgi:hypothetical protein